ncbi:MAG: TolC family protein [Thermoguttaceae bacterium]|nr:TolC family protein [Thermoguttaceae bacterium]MDW8077593.1 TolC family protein [Thermoguttaceae bacterium]
MRRHISAFLPVMVSLLALGLGCRPQQPFFFREDGDLSHYVEKATEIEYPDVEEPSLADAALAQAPLTVSNPDPQEYWDLSLEEAMRIALANSKVFRVVDQPQSLLVNGDFAGTVYDPALAESNPRSGPEAALAAFDAQLATSLMFQKHDTPQNSAAIGGFRIRPQAFQQDLGTFQMQLRKMLATGGTVSLTHRVIYDFNNQPFRQHPSDWNVAVEAQFSQPLLQGNGVRFNRIAGPGSPPGIYQGVVIARINTDISLTDFEAEVRDLVFGVERAYWELYYAYRSLNALNRALGEALDTWQKVRAEYDAGKASIQDEGLARHQYFLLRSLAEQSQANLFRREASLRYVMGLAPADGRLIRPSDEPTTAKFVFDWNAAHAEALVRSVNLRRQRWRVKQRELELAAAKNHLLPRLDLTGAYRFLGLGDELIDPTDGNPNPTASGSDAYSSLMSGDFQEWELGVQLSLPLGFRREMAAVRHAELQLARDRAVLQEQELALVQLLADAYRAMDESYVRAQTNLNRLLAAQRELEGYKERERVGLPVRQAALNFILDSQRRVAEAEIDYFRALVDYNLAIANFHYHKGSLLEYNGVYLAEGPWPQKAYFDALRRARARDAALYIDYGFTEPPVVSRGAYEQHAGLRAAGVELPDREVTLPPKAEEIPAEVIPTPPPEPAPQEKPEAAKPETDSSVPTQPKSEGEAQPAAPANPSTGAATQSPPSKPLAGPVLRKPENHSDGRSNSTSTGYDLANLDLTALVVGAPKSATQQSQNARTDTGQALPAIAWQTPPERSRDQQISPQYPTAASGGSDNRGWRPIGSQRIE